MDERLPLQHTLMCRCVEAMQEICLVLCKTSKCLRIGQAVSNCYVMMA